MLTIHGVFYKQSQKKGMDPQGLHAWLADGRLQARTEGFIIAALDGIVHTRAYRARVLEDSVSTVCRACRTSRETVGHLLSSCEPLKWNLYKDRHDRVLYQLVLDGPRG